MRGRWLWWLLCWAYLFWTRDRRQWHLGWDQHKRGSKVVWMWLFFCVCILRACRLIQSLSRICRWLRWKLQRLWTQVTNHSQRERTLWVQDTRTRMLLLRNRALRKRHSTRAYLEVTDCTIRSEPLLSQQWVEQWYQTCELFHQWRRRHTQYRKSIVFP